MTTRPMPLSIFNRLDLARISMAERLGESSMKMGASLNTPAASVRFTQSFLLKKPLLIFEESTRASAHSIRMDNCSFDISKENIATGTLASMAAFLAIFKARAVFPMLGRPARMMRSEF